MPALETNFSTTRPPAPRPRSTVGAVALLALAFLPATPAAAAGYAKGEEIVVTGIVADADGRPLPGVEVVLTGHRREFDLWKFKQNEHGSSTVTATTDEKGAFSIDWRWDPFYNRFRLAAGIRQNLAGEEKWWEVGAADLTRAIKRGNPVVANLSVDSADEVRGLQAFVDGLESDDARRVYQEMGKPDKVQTIQLPRGVEATWWYFGRGKLYRFIDGRLESSESFEPIEARPEPS